MPDLIKRGSLLIENALIFDGKSTDLREGSVLIVDGMVAAEGSEVPADIRKIDAGGGVVTPGFIDAHFHAYAPSLNLMHNETRKLSYIALVGQQRLARALARGFTTVRDVAGGDAGFYRGIVEGRIKSSRYLWSGPALSQTGGHGDPTDVDDTLCFHGGPGMEVVDGIENLRTATRSRLRDGASVIKIMASGGVTSLVDPIAIPQYTHEEIAAVCAEAERRGRYVAAHAYSSEAVARAVGAGVRSVEHGNLIDRQTVQLMAERGAYLVPTLITYDAMSRRGAEYGLTAVGLEKNSEVLTHGRYAIEYAHEAGVPVGFGSDLMGDLEDEQLGGLRLQQEILGTLELLKSVTIVNAELLQETRLGHLNEGAFGDALIFTGNPLENPDLLWDQSARTVVQAGLVVQESL